MNILTIIIIGMILLVLIAIWANKNDKTFQESNIKLSPEELEKKFKNLSFEGGTLKIWGKWFGRPFDNYHKIEKIKFNKIKNELRIWFDEKEILLIQNPSKIHIGEKEFKIKNADKIKFEWYLYGEEQTDKNLKFESFTNAGISIKYETNFHLEKRITETKITEPAVMIINL